MLRHALRPGLAAALLLMGLASPVAHAIPGEISTVAGGTGIGPATGIGMVPTGVATGDGRLIVGDAQNGTVRAVELATGAAVPVAGIGAAGFGADRLPALRTALPGTGNSFVGPQQIALAPDGDALVAVPGGSTIRRVDAATGIMSIVAGNGTFSSAGAGDGLPATSVSLGAPYGVALTSDGAVLLADTSAGRVRRVDPATGTIGTVAAGLSAPYHLAVAPDGAVLVAEYGAHRLRRIAPDGSLSTLAGTGSAGSAGDGGPAAAATLNRPWGVAVLGGGDIAVSENAGRRIRLITSDGEISTIGPQTLDAPAGLAATGDRLFVAESGVTARRVRAIALPGGEVQSVAGNGTASFSGEDAPAVGAQLSSPWGVTVAPDGRIVVADTTNFRIRAIDPSDGRIRTLAGSGVSCPSLTDATCVGAVAAATAKFVRPWDVSVGADGAVYQLESNAAISRLSRLDPVSGIVTAVAGGAPGYAGDGGLAAAARFGEAQGVAVAEDAVYVADTGNARVRRIDRASGTIETIAGTGTAGYAGDGGPAIAARIASPTDVALTAGGDLLIADAGNRRVRRVDLADGVIETVAGDFAFASVRGVAAGPRGEIAVADSLGHSVYVIRRPGAAVERVAGTGSSGFDEGRLAGPASLAFERDGDLIVADTANNRIRRIEGPVSVDVPGAVGGTVPATLSLGLGSPANFGTFTPGVSREYTATTTATVISSAGDAALTVSDSSTTAPGHLVNGVFALPQPLLASGSPLPATLKTYTAPIANDAVALTFRQAVGAGDPLRTGRYEKTLVFTLSTSTP